MAGGSKSMCMAVFMALLAIIVPQVAAKSKTTCAVKLLDDMATTEWELNLWKAEGWEESRDRAWFLAETIDDYCTGDPPITDEEKSTKVEFTDKGHFWSIVVRVWTGDDYLVLANCVNEAIECAKGAQPEPTYPECQKDYR